MFASKKLEYTLKKLVIKAQNTWNRLVRWGKKHPIRAGVIVVLLLAWLFCLPRPLFNVSYCAVLEDRSGYLLGARIATDGQWRFPVKDTLPEKYIKALLRFEDRLFYYHPGVNPASTLRALGQNLKAAKTVSGGSTITMQVIRLARNNPPRTIAQKIIEVAMATRLELTYSKQEILALYAAHAPFGGNVVGLDAASWRYFGKNPNTLTWAEAALMAILPNSPALLHPGRGQDLLLEKRNRLLKRLMEAGEMDAFEFELAKSEPLPSKPVALPQLATHLLDRLQAQQKQGREQAVFRTTVEKELQVRLSEVLWHRQNHYKGNEVYNMAAIVIDVPTGAVLAYVGNVQGAGAAHQDQVDMVAAPRSTGSILKPYLYAWSLQSGDILPNSLLPDVPSQFGGYRPENYKETYDGSVSAQLALVRSLNVPFVHLLREHGLEKFHFELKSLGLTTLTKPPSHYGLSLILGGAEANLAEVTNAYACMARRLGRFYTRNGKVASNDFRPYTLLSNAITKEKGLVRQGAGLSPAAIWHTFQAMQEVERPNSSGDWQMFQSSRRIAWKTGTSFGFRDAWAVGTNARYAVGVWVGNADGEGRPGLIGVEMAAPVLFDVFNRLPGGDDWFDPPYDDMVQIPVCRKSGFRANAYCATDADTLWVARSGLNAPACANHQLLHLDASGQYQVNSSCASPTDMQHVNWFVLDPQSEFYYRSRHPEYVPPPPFRGDCSQGAVASEKTPLRVIYPRENAQIYIPVDLDGQYGSVVFQATHREENAEIFWHLDDQYVGTTHTFHQIPLQPSVGKHRLTLVDKAGNRYVRGFEVLSKLK